MCGGNYLASAITNVYFWRGTLFFYCMGRLVMGCLVIGMFSDWDVYCLVMGCLLM